MIICHCKAVTDTTIRNAVRSGLKSLCEIGKICHAGVECAGCRPAIEKIMRSESNKTLESASSDGFCTGPDHLVTLSVVRP